jgi:hypothetical protein
MVSTGNFENKRVRGHGEREMPLVRGGRKRIALSLKGTETQRWRQQFVRSKWPHINEEIAFGKILNGSKLTN